MKNSLDILVLSDLHYTGPGEKVSAIPARRTELGPVLLEKAFHRLRHKDVSVDLIVLLGDMVNDGDNDTAEDNLKFIAGAVRDLGVPVLAVPGNHDGDQARYAECFGCDCGLHKIGGYGFVVFYDDVATGDVTSRPQDELQVIKKYAAENPGLPLIALQHNPLHPDIESSYPFMLTNRAEVLSGYIDAGVILSLSGHYHAGQIAHKVDGMMVYTVPSICEDPFTFAHIRLQGHESSVVEHSLKMDIPSLMDTHCHTEYAYCSTTVTAKKNIVISEAMGLHQQYFTEHAFHLYFDRDYAWSFNWQSDDTIIKQVWDSGSPRMAEFRRFVKSIRSDFVKVGLEVDLRADGSLLLADNDRDGWDIFIGAIHSIPDCDTDKLSVTEIEKLFLRETERMLEHPIDVLAHPFRFFRRRDIDAPVHIYSVMAEMLAKNGVAAEINFHTNSTDPLFIKECIRHGVKIAFGTDSHALWEVGELAPHLMVLRAAGVEDCDIKDVLFEK
jgi:histidinol phosphatase-like PHP family hydrolase/predicted MPP superfamily phosphohydrolase